MSSPRFIVLSGASAWGVASAADMVKDHALWIAGAAPPGDSGRDWIGPARARRLLGATVGHVVFDAHGDFDPDLFALTAGAIDGRCALLLLMPPLADWAGQSRFRSRFARRLQADPAALLIRQGEARALPSLPDCRPVTEPSPATLALDDACRTADQREAVDQILRVAGGHRRRPLVLRSDRGRGKSSAMAIAALMLLERGARRILVTAPRLASTDALFSLLPRLRPDGHCSRGRFVRDGGEIAFRAPDALAQNAEPADLLLVDEAAAIPAPMLARFLDRHSRVVFATTEHGYEGNGRGFAIRFRKTLDRRTPGWRQFRLRQPVRWAGNDPLERFIFDALLLKAEPAAVVAPEGLRFERLNRDELVGNERRLEQLYGLLVAAHYRTTAADLRQLLDDPRISVFAALADGAVAGVAIAVAEGGFDAALDARVRRGERRLKGHLAPQDLAAHLGLVGASQRRCLRILRIATHPDLQRRGVASALLRALSAHARQSGADYLAASFGADPGLMRFWRRNGFRPARLGVRRNAVSGLHSALVLKPLSDLGRQLADDARRQFRQTLVHLLAESLRQAEPETVAALFRDDESGAARAIRLDRETRLALQEFAASHRSLQATWPALWRLTLTGLENGADLPALRLLIMKILQKRSFAEIAALLGLDGKTAAERALRAAVRQLIGSAAQSA